MSNYAFEKFSSTHDAATRLSSGTYTGTIAREESDEERNSHRIGEFSSTHDAATRLGSGTYTGTIAREDSNEQNEKLKFN